MGRKNRQQRERQTAQDKQSAAKFNFGKKYEGEQAEKKFRLTLYYKITGIFTILVAILYAAMRIVQGKGYVLMNTGLQYWVWYALVIGVVLVLGRYISDMPKSQGTRKIVKIVVSIATICLLLLTYVQCIQLIDSGYFKYATIESPDGEHTVVIMRQNLSNAAISEEEIAEDETVNYTFYKAYPVINKYFCDTRGDEDFNMIALKEAPDARIYPTWNEDGTLTLTTDAEEDSILAFGDEESDDSLKLDTIVVDFN